MYKTVHNLCSTSNNVKTNLWPVPSSWVSLHFFCFSMDQRSFCHVKGTTVSVHITKAFRRSRRIALLALTIGARYTWVVNFTRRPLYPRGKSRGTYRRLGWTPQLVWTIWRTEKFLNPAGKGTPDGAARSLVTLPTANLEMCVSSTLNKCCVHLRL